MPAAITNQDIREIILHRRPLTAGPAPAPTAASPTAPRPQPAAQPAPARVPTSPRVGGVRRVIPGGWQVIFDGHVTSTYGDEGQARQALADLEAQDRAGR